MAVLAGWLRIEHPLAVNQDAMCSQSVNRLAMSHHSTLRHYIIGHRRLGHERHPTLRNLANRGIDVLRPDCDMLNALTLLAPEVFDNLPGLAAILVDRYTYGPQADVKARLGSQVNLPSMSKNQIFRKLNRRS